MDLRFDGEGPMYLQLTRALRSAIRQGRLLPGTRLPSTRQMCIDLGLSRTTVVAAYELLRDEGVLSGKIGSGSYITAVASAPVVARTRAPAVPQSAFSRRVREVVDAQDVQRHQLPGARYDARPEVPFFHSQWAAQWTRELARAARYVKLSYPPVQGFLPLREAICGHIGRERGVVCSPDDILIVHGAQQAMALIGRVLVDPGDPVVLEEPHPSATRSVLQMLRAHLHPMSVNAAGLRAVRLPRRDAKLLVLTPSNQEPGGTSSDDRREWLDEARARCRWICELEYDAELRRGASRMPALQPQDRDGRILYVGTFSRTLFPGLRLGYIVMPPSLAQDLIAAKWAEDLGNSCLEQAALAQLIQSGAYERHLRSATRELTERREVLRHLLVQACGERVQVYPAPAGMYVVAWIPDLPADTCDALVRRARERGLALQSIAPYCLSRPSCTGLIMGVSALSTQDLPAAVAVFADCLGTFAGGNEVGLGLVSPGEAS